MRRSQSAHQDRPTPARIAQKWRAQLEAPQPLTSRQLACLDLDDPHCSEEPLPELLPPILTPRDEVYQALSVWWRLEQDRQELLRGQALWTRDEWDQYYAQDAAKRAMQCSELHGLSSAARAYLCVHSVLHLSGVVLRVWLDLAVQAEPCLDLV